MNQSLKIDIIQELKLHIQAHYPVSDLILFGSQAKNEAKDDSDYDVLIILNSKYAWKDEHSIYALCGDICLKYGILVDAHILSKSELKTLRGIQPIYTDAISEGIYA
jgi:predicted nucleotidyltransferase